MRLIKKLFDLFLVLFFLKIYKRIDRVESTTGYSDLQFLFLAARDGWGEGDIVEIGSYKGKSTVALALGSKLAEREKVFSIDPHTDGTKEIFLKNLHNLGVEDYVIPRVNTSEGVAKTFNSKIRLLFIDGNHEYEFVKKDILLWKDFLIEGGIVAFHDYNREGVSRAINELVINSGEFIIEGTIGCTLLFSKGLQRNRELFVQTRLFNRIKGFLRPWKRITH